MAPVTWVVSMRQALEDRDVHDEVLSRLQSCVAAVEAVVDEDSLWLELLDLYDAAQDLLRRWRQAQDAVVRDSFLGSYQADILLNDFRPIRPYAVRLGEQITGLESQLGSRQTLPKKV